MAFIQPVTLDALNTMAKNNLVSHVGIEFTDFGDNWLQAKMPVDQRTKQPFGLLHGGASVVLAETLGSCAGNLCVDNSKFMCVGLEINANHLRAQRSGYVFGTAKPVHIGRNTHVWSIEIVDEDGKLCCISRITLAVVPIQL